MSKERIEQINKKILMLHEHENQWNKSQAKMDLQIKGLYKQKASLAKKISNNMKYCNRLLTEKYGLEN